MPWHGKIKRKCIACGYEFESSSNTLSVSKIDYGKCPLCGNKTKVITKPVTQAEIYKKLGIKL